MGREIKFRAYCPTTKEWFDRVLASKYKDGPCAIVWDKERKEWVNHDGPLMQFTGLKDKNGVEIFEGDILDITGELFSDFGRLATGKFDTTYKKVIWMEDSWGCEVVKSNHSVISSKCKNLKVTAKYGVVIGNVYSVPELLGAKS
jgi:uncharacterized phage protein (TIGR01671 family)